MTGWLTSLHMQQSSARHDQLVVFVTVASSGIEQALARRYNDAGYRLALVARRTRAQQGWADEQSFSVGSYHIYHADVSAIDSVVTARQACSAAHGCPM